MQSNVRLGARSAAQKITACYRKNYRKEDAYEFTNFHERKARYVGSVAVEQPDDLERLGARYDLTRGRYGNRSKWQRRAGRDRYAQERGHEHFVQHDERQQWRLCL